MSNKKQKNGISLVLIVSIVIFVYLLILLIRFLASSSVKYMVAERRTLTDQFTVKAVITREETLVRASATGVVEYYYAGGEKLRKNTRMGVLLDAYYGDLLEKKMAQVYEELDETETEYPSYFADIDSEMYGDIVRFLKERPDGDLDSLQLLKEKLLESRDYRRELYTLSANKRVLALLQEAGVYLNERAAESQDLYIRSACLIEYSYDGYEGWTPGQIGADFIDYYEGSYRYLDVALRNREKGEPLYRMITSETWNLTMYLSTEEASFFSGREEVSFLCDGEKMTAKIRELREESGRWKLVLELNSRMQTYVNERVLELTFVRSSVSGIVVSEECLDTDVYYYLPRDFVTRSGLERTVLRKGEEKDEPVSLDVIWSDELYYYFKLPEGLREGDTVLYVRPADASGPAPHAETAEIRDSKELTGVLVVNGNNEVFKAVEVLYREGGYAVIEGISQYDRVKIR